MQPPTFFPNFDILSWQSIDVLFSIMGQRGKMLETDGPTPKFLYAVLKQLDLKNVSAAQSLRNSER